MVDAEAEQQIDAQVVQRVLKQVFVPLLQQQALDHADTTAGPTAAFHPHVRVLSDVQKLVDILQHIDQQVPGAVH